MRKRNYNEYAPAALRHIREWNKFVLKERRRLGVDKK